MDVISTVHVGKHFQNACEYLADLHDRRCFQLTHY
jgi:hypothetical protein